MSRLSSAFTLIELLVSLAVLVLVVTALIALYHAALQSTEVADRTTVGSQVSAAIEQLLRDLTCAANPEGSEEHCHFEAIAARGNEDSIENGLLLSFCTTALSPEAPDPRWYSLEQVTYRWTVDEPALMRITTPIVGGVSETNILVPRVEQLRAQFFDGAQWRATWSTGHLPRAARVVWREEGQTLTAETFIAAGMIFTSTVFSTATRTAMP